MVPIRPPPSHRREGSNITASGLGLRTLGSVALEYLLFLFPKWYDVASLKRFLKWSNFVDGRRLLAGKCYKDFRSISTLVISYCGWQGGDIRPHHTPRCSDNLK